jgi:hypothetical protein
LLAVAESVGSRAASRSIALGDMYTMRSIFVSFVSACFLGLIVGCGESPKAEMPTHPVPIPKNPTFVTGDGKPAQVDTPKGPATPPPPATGGR